MDENILMAIIENLLRDYFEVKPAFISGRLSKPECRLAEYLNQHNA